MPNVNKPIYSLVIENSRLFSVIRRESIIKQIVKINIANIVKIMLR